MAEGGDTFTFIQKDFMVRSFSVFCDMKKTGELSDMSIRIDQRVFMVHRIILAAVIPYFRTMFASNLVESKTVEVTMEDLDPDALESLIDFAYTNKVTITAQNVQSLLVASDVLQILQVRDSCCEFMSKNLDPSNVMQVRKLAESLNCSSLVRNSDSYIRRNFDSFCQGGDFLSLPFSFLKDLIKSDDLRVKSEENVFEAVLTWVKSDTGRDQFLPEILTGVRMTFLSPDFLVKRASTEKLIQESIPCRNLLDEAKHYHLLRGETPPCSFALSKRGYIAQENIYVFCSNNSVGLTVFKYSPVTQKLSTVLNDKTRKDVKYVVALNDVLYVFRSRSFESFNPVNLRWTTLTNYISDGPFINIVPFANKIYWCQKYSHGQTSDVFDPTQNKWVGFHHNVQLPKEAVVVSTETWIYFLSNIKNSSGYVGKIYMHNPQTGTTQNITSRTESMHFFAGAALNKKIYACGGRRDVYFAGSVNYPVKSGEMYNPSTEKWVPISPMKTSRENFSLVSDNKKLFAFGGTMGNGRFNNSIECYDPKTDEWTTAGQMNGTYDFVQAVVTSAEAHRKDSQGK